jgi:acyl-CoA reductase-like NAD-dependent aldehyde dehydrogenase
MTATTTNASKATLDFTTFKNTINNELVDTAKHSHGINPATREKLPDVPVATKADLEDAVKAARAAFKKWRNVPRAERNAVVLKFADLIEANAEGFTTLLTMEQGKPVREAFPHNIEHC